MPSTFELIRRDLRKAQEFTDAALSRIHNNDISQISMEEISDLSDKLRELQAYASYLDMGTKPYR